jgi:hypothetical protein
LRTERAPVSFGQAVPVLTHEPVTRSKARALDYPTYTDERHKSGKIHATRRTRSSFGKYLRKQEILRVLLAGSPEEVLQE